MVPFMQPVSGSSIMDDKETKKGKTTKPRGLLDDLKQLPLTRLVHKNKKEGFLNLNVEPEN